MFFMVSFEAEAFNVDGVHFIYSFSFRGCDVIAKPVAKQGTVPPASNPSY